MDVVAESSDAFGSWILHLNFSSQSKDPSAETRRVSIGPWTEVGAMFSIILKQPGEEVLD